VYGLEKVTDATFQTRVISYCRELEAYIAGKCPTEADRSKLYHKVGKSGKFLVNNASAAKFDICAAPLMRLYLSQALGFNSNRTVICFCNCFCLFVTAFCNC